MEIVKPEKLVLMNNAAQLMRLVNEKFLIGDTMTVGKVFKEAAIDELGFIVDNHPDSPALMSIVLDSKPYANIKHQSKISDFVRDTITLVSKRRGVVVDYINAELISHASDLTDCDTTASKNYHMIDFSDILRKISTNEDMKLTPYTNDPGVTDFYTNYIGNNPLPAMIKKSFTWLIRDIEAAGYRARFLTTPTEVKIQVSLELDKIKK
jgi:hypothetical protein